MQPPTRFTDPEDNHNAFLSPFERSKERPFRSMPSWYPPHQENNMLLKKTVCQDP